MDSSTELRSNVNNMKYYLSKTDDLARQQLQKDMDSGKLTGINLGPTDVRLDALGIISTSCSWIETYLVCIENMIKRAEEQDAKLMPATIEEENKEGVLNETT